MRSRPFLSRLPRSLPLAGFLTLWLVAAPFASPCAAQDKREAASVSGYVHTITPQRVMRGWPNARVTLRNVDSGTTYATVTDTAGGYTFENVLAGACELGVSLEGFETEELKFELAPGVALRVDVAMRLRGVQAANGAADALGAGNGPAALPQDVRKPVAWADQQFQQTMPLEPGVERGPDGLLNMRGARNVRHGWAVNSSTVPDPATEQSAVNLPLEAREPARVVPNPFSAAQRRFADGVVDLDADAGTDRWRFGVRSFVPRLRWRDGSIWGIRAIAPEAHLSGPLKAGRAYFSQRLEYRFVRSQIESLPFIPEGEDDTQLEAFDSFTRVDVNLNASNRLTGSFAYFPQNQAWVNLNTFNPQEVTPNFQQRGFQASVRERAIFSGGGYLDSSFTVRRFDGRVFPSTPGPAVILGLFLFPDQNFGAWNSAQDRESILYQGGQDVHLRPLQAGGTHLLQFGYRVTREDTDGTVDNFPVTVVRGDGTTSQRIDFLQPEALARDKTDFAVYAHDHWQANSWVSVDLGVRLGREDIGGEGFYAAPRFGLTIAPAGYPSTVLRFGAGLYYDRVPLYLLTFLDYPKQILTRFAADGITVSDGPKPFAHRIATRDGRLRVPFTAAYRAQLDHEFGGGLLVRVGYEQRDRFDDFVVEPFESVLPTVAEFQLRNNGIQRYREFQAMLRWHAAERTTLYFSYTRSRAEGDLNTFDPFFGNFPTAILRPNERNRSPYDAPDRLLIWGPIGLPWKLNFLPVMDVRSGYPFSAVDDDLNFVGPRNRAGRYPLFFSLDAELTRRFLIPFAGRKWDVLVGARVFNTTNHWNPRDVQRVVTHPLFGEFFNTADREFRIRFEIEF